jgi:DNA-binding response OmpR family regulator
MTKVLAIDDDRSMTDLLATLLGSSGFEVMTANDGVQGLEMARAEVPDLVLLDLRMPGADGWSICRSLRAFSRVPIIILSALDAPESVANALDAGADDYLVKPVPIAVLLAHINNLTRQAIARRDSRPIGRQTASLGTQNSLAAGA